MVKASLISTCLCSKLNRLSRQERQEHDTYRRRESFDRTTPIAMHWLIPLRAQLSRNFALNPHEGLRVRICPREGKNRICLSETDKF